jgi:hypothetical protein
LPASRTGKTSCPSRRSSSTTGSGKFSLEYNRAAAQASSFSRICWSISSR